MGKYDKDRYIKELAVRYCLTRGLLPFLEVQAYSASDLSDSVEALTDLDVLGISSVSDGNVRKTLFDCKSGNRMSSINRAFWAAGVKEYCCCDDAFVILKNKAVNSHRLTALTVDVDLHNEDSFVDLGRTLDYEFPRDVCYQSKIERWDELYEAYEKNRWARTIFVIAQHEAPLAVSQSAVFRKMIAELRSTRGEFDPNKRQHLAIFFDLLCSAFVLWAIIGRDVRRFYEPKMAKEEFASVLRYYLWGGKEAYSLRRQLKERTSAPANGGSVFELPAWDSLVSFSGLVMAAPQAIMGCAYVCREVSLRAVSGQVQEYDKAIGELIAANGRVRQYVGALAEYFVAAGGLPKDLAKVVQRTLEEF